MNRNPMQSITLKNPRYFFLSKMDRSPSFPYLTTSLHHTMDHQSFSSAIRSKTMNRNPIQSLTLESPRSFCLRKMELLLPYRTASPWIINPSPQASWSLSFPTWLQRCTTMEPRGFSIRSSSHAWMHRQYGI